MLSSRDVEVLHFLQKHKAAPIDVMARLFFEENPQTGAKNKNPANACVRRFRALVADGYLEMESVREKGNTRRTSVVSMTSKAARELNVSKPNHVHGRSRDHHYASLRAGVDLQLRLEARGYKDVELCLEHGLRAAAQMGSAGRAGDTYASFPDAAVNVTGRDGRPYRIAVEYVTSKYCDEDICSKAASFTSAYDRIEWVGDSVQTAARITRLTGAPAHRVAQSLARPI